MRSKSFEGASGSYSRLYPITNSAIKGDYYHETSYGWEGEEIVERLNPSEISVRRRLEEGKKSNLNELFVALPTGEVYIKDISKGGSWHQFRNTEYGDGAIDSLDIEDVPRSVIDIVTANQ